MQSRAIARVEKAEQVEEAAPSPSLLGSFMAMLLQSLLPLANLFTPLLNQYRRFQSKGQGPLFIFIVLGTVLLVAGFGYLAKLVVSDINAATKVSFLMILALAIIVAGVRLSLRNGTTVLTATLMALGLLIQFVTLYVAGSYYQLLDPLLTIPGYFVVAAVGIVLAHFFASPVISALSILGVQVLPLLWGLGAENLSLYLLGLALLIGTNLYLAWKNHWHSLGLFIIAITLAAVSSLSFSPSIALFYFTELLALALSCYLLAITTVSKELNGRILLLLAAVSCVATGLLYANTPEQSSLLPWAAVANCLIYCLLYWQREKLYRELDGLFVALASYWSIVALFAWLSPDYWSIALGLEGLLLLFIANRQQMRWIGFEAQALILLAIGYGVALLLPYFPLPAMTNIKGISVLLSIGLMLFAWQRQLPAGPERFRLERIAENWLVPLGSCWILVSLLGLGWAHLNYWWGLLIIPLQLVLLWRARYFRCQPSEWMALLCLVPLFVSITAGTTAAQSYQFYSPAWLRPGSSCLITAGYLIACETL